MENEETGAWACEDEWKAHEAPIAKLSWAHPEFGAVIASASFDRAVKIWEQAPSFLVEQRPSGSGTARWIERALLTEAKGSVRAVEFAPSHFGLRLVSRHLSYTAPYLGIIKATTGYIGHRQHAEDI